MTGQTILGSTELTAAQIDPDADYMPVVDASASGAAKNKKLLLASLLAALAVPMEPGGRLTLTSNTPVMTGDATAAGSIYYAPYKHARLPIYSGTMWFMRAFSQLTMALDTSNQLASKVYDLFAWNNAGTIAIGAGPAWSRASTVTMTIATPGVISWTAHGLSEGDPVVFTNAGGALPTGITAGTTYYVSVGPATDSFSVSTTVANAAAGTKVATSGSQSGVHTATNGTRTRGTGAGTTELELKDGIWTNKNSITLTNGAGAGTSGIAANNATYLGSCYCTANGQTGMAFLPAAASGGTNNVLGLYNAYNRVNVAALCRDAVASYTYNSATVRASNGSVANRITYLDGLRQSPARALFNQHIGGAASRAGIGVLLNATTGTPNIFANVLANCSVQTADMMAPTLGVNYVQAVESDAANTTFYGLYSAGVQAHALRLDIDL
jgi:hypothetical protein